MGLVGRTAGGVTAVESAIVIDGIHWTGQMVSKIQEGVRMDQRGGGG